MVVVAAAAAAAAANCHALLITSAEAKR